MGKKSLPVCRPLCETPDDQGGKLDVSKCQDIYVADGETRKPYKPCILNCVGDNIGAGAEPPYGGPDGEYYCKVKPGKPATGQWEPRSENWPKKLPVCGAA